MAREKADEPHYFELIAGI